MAEIVSLGDFYPHLIYLGSNPPADDLAAIGESCQTESLAAWALLPSCMSVSLGLLLSDGVGGQVNFMLLWDFCLDISNIGLDFGLYYRLQGGDKFSLTFRFRP